jgi:hypothetical protein
MRDKAAIFSMCDYVIIFVIFFVALLVALWISVGPDKQDTSADSTKAPPVEEFRATANCEHGTPVSGRFYVKGREINFRTGPGTNYGSVVNQRATEVLGRTEYRTLSPDVVLEGRCETEEWLEAHIAEVAGSAVDWETGWVHKEFVTANASAEVQAGLLWDIDGALDFTDEEKALLKRGALKVLKDERNCKNIFEGNWRDSRKSAFFVTCNAKNGGPPFNVWFTPADVEAGGTLTAPKAYPEAPSRQACEEAIEARVLHPSTLDIHHFLGYATKVFNNSNRIVIQEFTAKNSFGLELKHRAQCLIAPNGSLEISITEMQ